MSAFIVEKATIDTVVTHMLGPAASPAHDVLGRRLWRMNATAVAARYRETRDECWRDYTFEPSREAHPVRVLKSIECFLYQCAEEHVPRFTLYKRVSRKAGRLARHIVSESPAYADAKWG
jgi:hypothetical protein